MRTAVFNVRQAVLAAAILAACSCARVPREGALLRSAREGGPYDVSLVAYDEKTRQATLELRQIDPATGSTNAVYRWYQYDGKAWRPMPMTAVRAPVGLLKPPGDAVPGAGTNRAATPQKER